MQRAHLAIVALVLTMGCDGNPITPDARMLDVSGSVTEFLGIPLAGVAVTTTDGPRQWLSVVTDAEGRFTLPRASGDDGVTLRLSRDGYTTATVRARPESSLVVSLWPVGSPGLTAGEYSMTVAADSACTALPVEARTRTYAGSLLGTNTGGSVFTITLGGATFFPTQRVIYGLTSPTNFALYLYSWEAETRWGDALPIVEQLDQQAYVAIEGRVVGPLSPASGASSVSSNFEGKVSYCAVGIPGGLWFQCATTPIDCSSKQHRATLTAK